MRILIIDDEEDMRLLLVSILKNAGYTDLLIAGSAEAAFKLLGMNSVPKTAPEVDMVLTDIAMPEVDGIETCRRIKAVKELKDIPVVIVTAWGEVSILESAFDVGAMDFITKPFHKTELLARVRSALRLKGEMDERKRKETELLELTSKLEEANLELQNLSSLDGLTGVSNRRHFDEQLDEEWKRAIRSKSAISLIMLDIDFFKAYNDAYGHQAGDECLKRMATEMSNALHRPGDLLARYGGEEFSAVLPETDGDGAEQIAEKMRSSVESLRIEHSTGSHVTISLGVATIIPSFDALPEHLISMADKALYKAKENGRNRVEGGI